MEEDFLFFLKRDKKKKIWMKHYETISHFEIAGATSNSCN